MPTVHVNVQVQIQSGIHTVTINPERVHVPPRAKDVVIVWNAPGSTKFLPANAAFNWKASGAPAVTRTDDHTLTSAKFDNPNTGTTELVWKYLIGVEGSDGVMIQVDPEADNDPPIGP